MNVVQPARPEELPGEASPLTAASGVRRRLAADLGVLEGLVVTGSGGRRVLRLLVPGACRYACSGCPMADQASLSDPADPERLARLAILAFRRGLCDGIFVSCGMPANPAAATERQLRLVRHLRVRLGFRGYLHAKVPPGAGESQVERLLQMVDRLSREPEVVCRSAAEGLAPAAWHRAADARGSSGATRERAVQLSLWAGRKAGRSQTESSAPGGQGPLRARATERFAGGVRKGTPPPRVASIGRLLSV